MVLSDSSSSAADSPPPSLPDFIGSPTSTTNLTDPDQRSFVAGKCTRIVVDYPIAGGEEDILTHPQRRSLHAFITPQGA